MRRRRSKVAGELRAARRRRRERLPRLKQYEWVSDFRERRGENRYSQMHSHRGGEDSTTARRRRDERRNKLNFTYSRREGITRRLGTCAHNGGRSVGVKKEEILSGGGGVKMGRKNRERLAGKTGPPCQPIPGGPLYLRGS